MAAPFIPSRRVDAWFFVGHSSSFPNTTESGSVILADEVLSIDHQADLKTASRHGCKVFFAPEKGDPSTQAERLSHDPKDQLNASLRTGEQVLVFQYKDQFHALDNVRAVPRARCQHLRTKSEHRNVRIQHIRCQMGRRSILKTLASHFRRVSHAPNMVGALTCSLDDLIEAHTV